MIELLTIERSGWMMMQAGKREEIAAGSHILVISNKVMIVLDDISDNIHSSFNKGGVSLYICICFDCATSDFFLFYVRGGGVFEAEKQTPAAVHNWPATFPRYQEATS